MRSTKPELLTRDEVATLVADLTGVAPPDPATVSRWQLVGVRGVTMAGTLVGGRRYTTREAVERFLRELNDHEEHER